MTRNNFRLRLIAYVRCRLCSGAGIAQKLEPNVICRTKSDLLIDVYRTSMVGWVRYFTSTLSIVVVAICFSFQCVYANADASKRSLGDSEVVNLLLHGGVENSIVSATAINKAIDAINNLTAQGKPVPKGILLKGCLIKGRLRLRSFPSIPIAFVVRDSVFENIVDFNQSWFTAVTFANVEFKEPAYFNEVTFSTHALFAKSLFRETVAFNNSVFMDHADFDGVEFIGDVSLKGIEAQGQLHFKRSVFKEKIDVSQAVINQMSFLDTEFLDDALFIGLTNKRNTKPKKHMLEFSNVSFGGVAYFNNTKIDNLWFTKDWRTWGLWEVEEVKKVQLRSFPDSKDLPDLLWEEYEPSEAWQRNPKRVSVPPVKFHKRAFFSGMEIDQANFQRAEFHDYVDFSTARFNKLANFNESLFDKEAKFANTTFPKLSRFSEYERNTLRVGLTFDDARFNDVPDFRWDQLKESINTQKIETLSQLEDVFRRTGTLGEQNEVMYHRRIKEAENKEAWSRFVDSVEYWFWGYRIRPLRVLFWMFVLYIVFAAVYWSQTKSLARNAGAWRGVLDRLKFSFKFSLLTSFKVGYGYQHSRTPFFKILTASQSLLFKGMCVCLLAVLSNTAPFIRDLIGRLLPL